MSASRNEVQPLVKSLAANDRATRDNAVEKLRQYLSLQLNASEDDFLKLWKGLFYCMWMSDRSLTQQRLAADLASLIELLQGQSVLNFLSAFWKTMAREYRGIDVLRMNKFLLLIRLYFRSSMSYFMRRKWSTSPTSSFASYIDIIREIPLNPTNVKVPDGLRYHLVDIYVDEIDKLDPEKKTKKPMKLIMEPLRLLGEQSPNRIVRKRVKETLADPRIVNIMDEAARDGQSHLEEHLDKEMGVFEGDEEWNGFGD